MGKGSAWWGEEVNPRREGSRKSAFRIQTLYTDAWDLGGDRLGGCIRDGF